MTSPRDREQPDAADESLQRLRGTRALIVASTGGHLYQAVRWHDRLGLDADSTFVSFRSPQSESLLAGFPHVFVPYVAPRDWAGVARLTVTLAGLQRRQRHSCLLSTGAGVALSCAPAAAASRVPFYYLESVSRFAGPSVSGKVLVRTPGVTCFTQHLSWAGGRWGYAGSLLDEYTIDEVASGGDVTADAERRRRRIFVTLGTIRPYRFDRLVDAVLALSQPDDDIWWQLGATTRTGLPGEVHAQVSSDLFDSLVDTADVVITHAGAGSLLAMLDRGVSPVVVPRRQFAGEHVDDHQLQVAGVLAERGLVTVREPEALRREDVEHPRPRVLRRSPDDEQPR